MLFDDAPCGDIPGPDGDTVMTADAKKDRVLNALRDTGQEHLVEWLSKLTDAERDRLIAQLSRQDFTRLAQFRRLLAEPPGKADLAGMEPAEVDRLADDERDVVALGEAALRADRVAVVAVAGGQGTRLQYEHPKGMYPITPLARKSLFEHFAEKLRAARRRYGCRLPWLIMTSPTNNAETQEFFELNDYFGLGAETVRFFIQRINPILDVDGRLLLDERDELLVGAGGHGGTFAALADAGLPATLTEQGHDLISYFQIDNPLVTVADPRFIGYHLKRDAEFSCKVMPKRDSTEGLGLAVLLDGRPAVAEYSDVPAEIQAETLPDGELRFLFGSIGIHIIDVAFVERVVHSDALPWHIARKTYERLDANGAKVMSAKKGCVKFERFIFDALELVERCAFVEVCRETEFAPVKNAEGDDSPTVTRRMMQQEWLDWLCQAGAVFETPDDLDAPHVEISPLYAATLDELKARTRPGHQLRFPLILTDE
jgi:UDP-N-acetylglucosamine pyrophosphorylase